MLLAELATVNQKVTATSKRSAKIGLLAELLRSVEPAEVEIAVGLLCGSPRQGKVGIGWATATEVSAPPAPEPAITLGELDRALDEIAATSGAGSTIRRRERLGALLARATRPEQDYLRRILLGEVRQGALEGLVTDAVAKAYDVPATSVRRAAMLSGDLGLTAATARGAGRAGLDSIGLAVGRPIKPMLASTSESPDAAIDDLGLVSVEWKLDGARIQVHRDGEAVSVFTRNLNDVTERLPGVVDAVRALPVDQIVLDGETLGIDEDAESPGAFQDTMSSFGRHDSASAGVQLRPFFFDCLHVDGDDLLDHPLSQRLATLRAVAGDLTIPGVLTDDAGTAATVLEQSLAAGNEGVMVKAAESAYVAGRRGKTWRKVKPVHTLDLVVIAVDWGHGRRAGRLSNLHLGARDPAGDGFIMVGKTFKGMTDELLAWQTDQLLRLEVAREGITVHVRPELVVEIAVDGVQRSSRYPGGVALRFARVRGYRLDKRADEADTIDTVRSLSARGG